MSLPGELEVQLHPEDPVLSDTSVRFLGTSPSPQIFAPQECMTLVGRNEKRQGMEMRRHRTELSRRRAETVTGRRPDLPWEGSRPRN